MKNFFLCFWIIALIAGCGSALKLLNEESESAAKAISIQEAFQEAKPLRTHTGTNIVFASGQVPLIRVGLIDMLAVPATIDDSKSHYIKIKSYLSRRNDGSLVIVYPVLSIVDRSFNLYRTIKPKYALALTPDGLTNEFEVPVGIEKILIHADQENSLGSSVFFTSPYRPSGGAYGIAGLLGGPIGALILHSATEQSEEYRFGDVGVIQIDNN